MFDGVTLSTTNYDALLNGWNAQTLHNGVTFSGGASHYCNSEAARTHMLTSDAWVISDGGKRPYRLRCRGACFYVFQAFNRMVKGGYLSDTVAALGSLNVVAGELEK